ncbi:MAG: type II toxin-antitoxin system Phd/YefM family antitoxin [Acidobacteria bacterium]|nr:type II toxin-antitoxin system Phd/YefM family antitoxin [Acidobacteriota bacterium]
MATYNIYEAKAHFSKLVDEATHGKEVVIAKSGKPLLKLVPIEKKTGARRIGGQNLLEITYIAPDFDAPMSEEELKDWGY